MEEVTINPEEFDSYFPQAAAMISGNNSADLSLEVAERYNDMCEIISREEPDLLQQGIHSDVMQRLGGLTPVEQPPSMRESLATLQTAQGAVRLFGKAKKTS